MRKKIIQMIRLSANRLMIGVVASSLLLAVAPTTSFAQAPEEKVELSGTRKQLATIVFAGLAGAILGLSTLSFYGRPQDNLANIAIGFAVGVIGGASYTTYKAATQPYEAFDINGRLDQPVERNSSYDLATREYRPMATWQWSF